MSTPTPLPALTPTQSLLKGLGSGLSLSRDGGPLVTAGQLVKFQLLSPNLSSLTVPVVTSGNFSLTAITKNVRFLDANPAPLNQADGTPFDSLTDALASYFTSTPNPILGGLPIANVQIPLPGPSLAGAIPPTTNILIGSAPGVTSESPSPLPGQTAALAAPVMGPSTGFPTGASIPPIPQPSPADLLSGTPGLIGQLAGSIPVLVNAPVSLSVVWSVYVLKPLTVAGGGSRGLGSVDEPRTLPSHPALLQAVPLVEGKDFFAPLGLNSSVIDLIFAPVLAEFGQEQTSTIYVSATVTLSAFEDSIQFTSADLPGLNLQLNVADIGIPRLLASFSNANYSPQDGGNKGTVLLMIPAAYPLRTLNDISQTLANLQTLISNLRSLAGVFGWITGFLTGLGDLIDAIPSQPDVQVVAADYISDLDNINFEYHHFWNGGDVEADDAISSAILIGLKGAQARFYNDANFSGSTLTLTTGEQMWAALTSFTFNDQQGSATYAKPDPSVVVVSNNNNDNYNDQASSISFLL